MFISKNISPFSKVLYALFALLLPLPVFSQTSSSWKTDALGNWSDGTKWLSGTPASGADQLADFSLIDITADRTVTVNAAFTIGALKFADTTQTNIWTLASSGTNVLTLQTTTGLPSINVASGGTTIISARLGGTQGFDFTGAGILRLSGGTNNSFTGNVNLVTAGSTLQFTTGSLNSATGVVFQADSSLTWQANHTNDLSAKIKINDGVTATLNLGSGNVTFASALQTGASATGGIIKNGGGTLTITAANTFTGLFRARQGRTVLSGGDNRLSTTGTIAIGQAAQSGILQLGDSSGASNQTTLGLTSAGAGNTGNYVVGGNAAVSTLTINNADANTYGGQIGGAGTNENNIAIVKGGAGVLTLSSTASTFTGGVTINSGTISFASGALGSAGLITYAGTSSLQWATGNTSDLSARIKINDGVVATIDTNGNNITFATALQTGTLGSGALTKGSTGTLTITGANTYTGATRINNGRMILTGGDGRLSSSTTLQFGNAANSGVLQLGDATGASNQTVVGLAVSGNVNSQLNAVVGGNAAISTLTINNAGTVTWAQMLGGTGTNENNLAFVKSGAGTLTLSGASNTFIGDVGITGGILAITKSGALGASLKTITISGTTDAPTLKLDGSNGDISLASNLSFITSNDSITAPAILSSAGNNLIAGNIAPTTGGFGTGNTRIKVTAGTLTLNGGIAPANSATGPVSVIFDVTTRGSANGVISDNGSHVLGVTKEGAGTWSLTAANSYTGATTVNAGQLNITTSQTGGGALTVADGAALGLTLSAAGQTLNTSALTLGTSTGSALYLNLGSFSNPTAALINATTFSTSGSNVLNISGTGLSVGTINLISYTGSIGGAGFGGLTLGTLPARVTANLVDNTGASKVQLNISAFDVPKWTGAASSDWDINDGPDPATGTGSVNWKETTSGTATRYLQYVGVIDSVRFDDSATGSTNINLTAQLTPNSILVDNTTKDYTFSGTGYLSGTSTLLKQGTGSLTIINSGFNDFTGATTISAGTLILGDGVTAGAGSYGTGAILNNGAIVLNRPEDFFFSNVLSGSGTLTKQGAGTAILSGNSATYSGAITVSVGTLKLGNANALGDTTGGTQVSSGATLDVTGFNAIAENIQLNAGTLKVTSATTNKITSSLVLNGGGTVDASNGATLTLSAALAGTGGLTKTGAGTLAITANSTFTGGTTILQGILQVGSTIATSTGSLSAGDITLNADGSNTATLNFRRSDTTLNISSNILTTSGTGTNAITIDNGVAGVITFSGTNTFTGNVTVNTGTLIITNSSALGIGTKTIRIAGGNIPSLQLDGSAGNITLSSDLSYALSSDGSVNTAGAISSVAGNNVINGTISQVNGGGGNARITVSAGTLTINGNIDANGATGNRNILLGGTTLGTVNGVISDFNNSATSIVGVSKDGTGTWVLNGANSFTGAVTVSAGTLKVNAIAANGTAQPLGSAISAVLIGSATTTGTLEYTGVTDATLGRAITVNGVGGGIIKNSGGAVLTLSGILTRVANRALTFSGGTFIVTGQITGASSVNNIDGVTVTFSNTTNNFVGSTDVFNGGTLKNGASEVLTDTSTLVLGEATGNTNGTYDLNGFNETLTGLTSSGTGTKIVTNSAASGISTLTISGTGSFDGLIQDGATAQVALTKSTTGTLTLSGTNTFTGALSITGGTLSVGQFNSLGSGTSAITLGSTAVGTLAYTGGTATLSRDFTINGTGGGVISNTGGGTLTLTGTLTKNGTKLTLSGGTINVSGQITGALANSDLIVTGGAVVTLTNATNDYNGPTLVNGGATLKNGVTNALPSTSELTLGAASGNTAGTYDLNGFNATVGGLNTAGTGANLVTNSAASGTQTLTVAGAGSFAGVIQDGATAHTALTKSGTGTLTLSAAETYTGKTTVSSGTLALSGAGSIQSSNWVQVDAGATLDVTGVSGGYAQNGSSSSGAISGTGTVAGPITVGGAVVLSAGASSDPASISTAGDGFGTLAFTGDLTLAGGATSLLPRALFQIGAASGNTTDPTLAANVLAFGSTSSTSIDLISVSGTLTLNSGSLLKITLDNYTPVYGDVFNLIDWSAVNLNGFDVSTDFELPTLTDPLLHWNTDQFANAGILYITGSVPEPSRALLSLGGVAALVMRRRRSTRSFSTYQS